MSANRIARPNRAPAIRHIVREFTPNWFAATMGTGILALAINQVAGGVPPLHATAEALWLLDIGLFALFTALYATRWLLFPAEAARIFRHSTMSMSLGTIPMGLATIINGTVVFAVPHCGQPAVATAFALWWVDVGLAVACGVGVPFLMFTSQDHALEKMTAVWLLPVVAAEVAAVSAAQLVPYAADPRLALNILVLGYILWSFSVPAALSLLVILLQRLALHKLPHRDMAASGWLALGPLGTGALGLLLLGNAAPAVFAQAGLGDLGAAAQGIGVIGGTVLWGYGAWWMLLAILITVQYARDGIPFNLGWWAYTFPLGVFSVATNAVGHATHLPALCSLACGLIVVLAIIWAMVAWRSVVGAWRLDLFVAPCRLAAAPAR
jgi:C4-dicarboxylate transporter/malic acid transport protein